MARAPHRLDTVARLAHHRRLLAEKALAEACRAVAARRDLLEQLVRFRDEYDGAGGRDGEERTLSAARTAAAFRDYGHFQAKLGQAIAQQRREIAEAEAACDELRLALQSAMVRAESLALVISRSQAIAARHAAAGEQRLMDELAGLCAGRRS